MHDPDSVLERWNGMVDNDFQLTIQRAFGLPPDDDYIYRVDGFSMTLSEVQEALESGKYYYWYSLNGQQLKAPPADIIAYTSIFASTASAAKSLTSFACNAKKGSAREVVAHYLSSRRLLPDALRAPKRKAALATTTTATSAAANATATANANPYYDLWAWSCQATGFVGPLGLAAYADRASARVTHPVLPVLYHHFGCVCPSYEALSVVARLAGAGQAGAAGTAGTGAGVVDVGSGSGYWAFLLRRMGVEVSAVDNMDAVWRMMWVGDTVRADAVGFLKKCGGARDRLLLMVYMLPTGDFTKRVLEAYKGDSIVVAGTQNENRFTSFSDMTVEQYFEREKRDFEMTVRIPLPSFAGKDEAMYVYQRKK